MSWALEVEHPLLRGQPVRLMLPRDFPATPAQMYVEKGLCLVLPHVEENGKVCLGVQPSAHDYDNPIGAVERVLKAFQEFLRLCLDPDWVKNELQRERLAYWFRYCEARNIGPGARPTPTKVYVALDAMDGCQEGAVAVYFEKGGNGRAVLAVGCPGTADPHALAKRHGLGNGTLVRGRAFFVPMAESEEWTPATWPGDLPDLDELVGKATAHKHSVRAWLEGQEAEQPSFVFLVQGPFAYGYQVFPPMVRKLAPPAIEPVVAARIDAPWALTRGHQFNLFEARRRRRVLVLGCGSLGSPVIELLVRAGVGHVVVVDAETFEPENCARHVLGLSATHASKAVKLAERLNREVPGADIKGHYALASSWVADCVRPDDFDLVVDCTGESSVRALLSRHREASLGSCPVVHSWLEPFCAAAHVVLLTQCDSWPADDPADEAVNAARWTEDTKVELPACGAGFHPYGAADVWQAAGFAAERILSAIDGLVADSTVWSWVRSRAFFEFLDVHAEPSALVPRDGSRFDAVMVTRSFREVVNLNG